jgi:pyruvate,water dikinase
MSLVLPLEDATDASLCGHKAATLASLARCGEPVPPGLVVTTAAVATLDEPGLRREIVSMLGTLDGPFAVRSSAIAEDGDDASFAGQYETFLNVSGSDAVIDAVRRCVASASAAHVQVYAEARRITHDANGVAVIIQEMVQADAAGVAFSADPRTGDEHVVLTACRGIADRLVSGDGGGDVWTVKDGSADAVIRTEFAIDESETLHIAELVHRVAATRGAPQDVEWAIAGGALFLLQARPITNLPIKPALDVPAQGTWTKDTVHYPELMTPFGADVCLPADNDATAVVAAEFGLLIDGLRSISVGGEIYSRVLPLGGTERQAPPWWALALACRISPLLRWRCQAAEDVVSSGALPRLTTRWESEWRRAFETDIERHMHVQLSGLGDAALLRELDVRIELFRRGQVVHFRLAIPFVVAIAEFVQGCEQMLGWDTGRTLELLSGLSSTSSGPARAMDDLGSQLRAHPVALDAFRDGNVDRLRAVAPEIAEAVSRYENVWAWRPFNYEPGSTTLAERPDLLVRQVLDRMDAAPLAADVRSRRAARVNEARSALRNGASQQRFDTLLERAARVYALREDNVLWTNNLPSGLIRRVLLEIGRRLCDRGHLGRPQDAAWLHDRELRDAIAGNAAPDLARAVARHKAERAWVRAHPGPDVLGAPPPEPPDLRGLPSAARTINQAVVWALGQELGARPASATDAITGLSVCGGRYTGTARVILGESAFERLRPGDVLVCRITTPAWSPLFAIAGAIVTETGSLLSHAAIVAREHGIPTVISIASATRKLHDGDIVTVDGTRGTVVIEKPGAQRRSA